MESSQPPPTQMPRIIEMVGFGICSIASSAPSKAAAYSFPCSLLLRWAGKSLMSAPAENALSPAPRRMTTLTPASCASWVGGVPQQPPRLEVYGVVLIGTVEGEGGDAVLDGN